MAMGMLDAFTTVIAIPFVVSLVAPALLGVDSEHAQKRDPQNIVESTVVTRRFIVNLFFSSLGTTENLIDKRCRRFVTASRLPPERLIFGSRLGFRGFSVSAKSRGPW